MRVFRRKNCGVIDTAEALQAETRISQKIWLVVVPDKNIW